MLDSNKVGDIVFVLDDKLNKELGVKYIQKKSEDSAEFFFKDGKDILPFLRYINSTFSNISEDLKG